MEDFKTRREFVATTISAGFALAVTPLAGKPILTSSKGLETGEVKILTSGVEMPAYWAAPSGKGPRPVLIVVHEIFGVHEHIQDLCRRYAKEGYFVIAPNLFFRYGDAMKVKEISDLVAQIVSKATVPEVLGDLDATLAYLKTVNKANTEKVGITGFCWGGSIVWLYSEHNPAIKAGVAWYGKFQARTPGAPSPLSIAGNLKVPVLGLYGGKDDGIPQTDVKQMEEKLAQGKSGSKIIVYPDSPHGFNADYRDSYTKKDALAGTREMFTWFKTHGLN